MIESFIFDRTAIVDGGQWWRLVTGHFAHLDDTHLALNLAGLIAIVGVGYFGDVRSRAIAGCAIFAILFIAVGLMAMPWIQWYLGLSGLLYALSVFTIGLIDIKLGRWLALALAATTAWRAASPDIALHEAHLLGLLAGQLALSYRCVRGQLSGMGKPSAGGQLENGLSQPRCRF